MRTLMLIGSLVLAGSGVFCFANGSAAFISVAFVVGIVFSVMGLIEAITGNRADFEAFGKGVTLTTDGIIMFFFGLVILSGQIADDVTAQMLFALWLLIEALISVGNDFESFSDAEGKDYAGIVLSVAMFAVSMYMFFNTRLININAIIMVGTALLLLGLRRFRLSFDIEYNKPGFLTGSRERLEEAMEDEKRALAKAKEGIKEQKAAQRRIEKIKEEITQERNILTETALRKQAEEEEKQLAEENNK